jgi:hypothetical protein
MAPWVSPCQERIRTFWFVCHMPQVRQMRIEVRLQKEYTRWINCLILHPFSGPLLLNSGNYISQALFPSGFWIFMTNGKWWGRLEVGKRREVKGISLPHSASGGSCNPFIASALFGKLSMVSVLHKCPQNLASESNVSSVYLTTREHFFLNQFPILNSVLNIYWTVWKKKRERELIFF